MRGVGAARGADAAARPPDEIRGSTTIVELLRMFPDGEAGALLAALALPCAHCGGAFHEPLTLAAKRHKRDPRAVLEAFRALASRRTDGRASGGGAPPRSVIRFLAVGDLMVDVAAAGKGHEARDRGRGGRLGVERGLLRGEPRSGSRGRGAGR